VIAIHAFVVVLVAIVVGFGKLIAYAVVLRFAAALAEVTVIEMFEVIAAAAARPVFVSAGRHDSFSGVWWVMP
jgi:hypothetical protein